MRYSRLSPDQTERYDEAGDHESYGELVVGEDHVVRWFSRDELAAMTALGDQNRPAVYEDAYGPGRARLA